MEVVKECSGQKRLAGPAITVWTPLAVGYMPLNENQYSRKYVFTTDELDELPPGMIDAAEIKKQPVVIRDILQDWEKTLGEQLFEKIVNGPKTSVDLRLRHFINGKINE